MNLRFISIDLRFTGVKYHQQAEAPPLRSTANRLLIATVAALIVAVPFVLTPLASSNATATPSIDTCPR
jgi:hypothetical protein